MRILFLLTLVLSGLLCSRAETATSPGMWSREATSLLWVPTIGKIEIPAPDRRRAVIIEDVRLDVLMDGQKLPGTENEGVGSLAEVAWSPDSRAFFVTESYGGEVGDWHVWVYRIENEKVRFLRVTEQVVKGFKRHYRCEDPEEPNIGAIKWVNGSNQLLVVAEVPPHSSCPEMGKIRGYSVEVPSGRIVREFGEKELRARWGRFLGQRFEKK